MRSRYSYFWLDRGKFTLVTSCLLVKLYLLQLCIPTPWLWHRAFYYLSIRFLMYTELCFPVKVFPKVTRFIRFLFSMNFLVFNKIWSDGEGLSTFSTHIRFLSCVNSVMFKELWLLNKGLPTVTAFIGFLSSMNSPMSI